jgi:hypothetical protein
MNLCRLLYHNTDGKIIAEITKTTIINIFIILEYISWCISLDFDIIIKVEVLEKFFVLFENNKAWIESFD